MSDIRKPNKERLLMTFRGEIPDRVPHFEIAIEDEIVEAILGRKAGSTLAGSRGASDEVLFSPPMDPKDYIEICNFNGQDVIGFEALWVPLKYKDENGKIHAIIDGRIKCEEDLKDVILPDWETDFAPRKKYFDEYREAVKGTDIGTFVLTGPIFQSCYQFLCGFSDFFCMLYSDRKFAEKMLDICVDYYLQIIDLAIEAKVSFMYLCDDIAYKSGTFVNPVLFKEIWLPCMNKLIKRARDGGLPIMFHSCGRVTDIFDDIIMEMDIDCINPIEPYSNDIFEIKRKYGDKITIAGNVDIAGPLAFGTPEEVRKVCKEYYMERLKVGGRYVYCTNHSIMNGIPIENYKAMLDVLFEYGVY